MQLLIFISFSCLTIAVQFRKIRTSISTRMSTQNSSCSFNLDYREKVSSISLSMDHGTTSVTVRTNMTIKVDSVHHIMDLVKIGRYIGASVARTHRPLYAVTNDPGSIIIRSQNHIFRNSISPAFAYVVHARRGY